MPLIKHRRCGFRAVAVSVCGFAEQLLLRLDDCHLGNIALKRDERKNVVLPLRIGSDELKLHRHFQFAVNRHLFDIHYLFQKSPLSFINYC